MLLPASAFTSVSARRTLSGTTFVNSSNPSQPQSNPARKFEWPQPVREYVSRCFADENNIANVSRDEVQAKLKDIITRAAESNTLDDVAWETHPLPQTIILNDRDSKASISSDLLPSTSHPYSHTAHNQGFRHTDNQKRKSPPDRDIVGDSNISVNPPPWRQQSSGNAFEDRITYASEAQSKKASKRQRKFQQETGALKESSKSNNELERRRQRFESDRLAVSGGRPLSRSSSPITDASTGPVVGTSANLEKKYFRLTAPPKPETVRPLGILRQSLDLLKKKWKSEKNYGYVCDQFKSLRQDLTVQHIKNEFTVNVYEIHARIALEKGDMGEYNQCQTQLRALYKQRLGGHPGEFLAYRILYFVYTCSRTDMNDVLADLTPTDRQHPAVRHALETRSALALGNHHKFFKLYMDTPNMGSYLMDMFLSRERLAALACACKS